MKLKGVGFFEAHIEKLLLGLMVAVAAGVVVLQFAGSPNDVTVRGQTLPPARAYDPVEQRAQQIDAQMSAADPDIPVVEGRDQSLAGLEESVRRQVSVSPRIIAFGQPAEIDDALFTGQAEDVEYAVITPPAPSSPVVASYAGTLDPGLLVDNDELAAIVGPSQPYDIAMVSVQTTYNGVALQEAYRGAGGGDRRALPFNWVNGIEALGLQLERQRQMPDGSWGQVEVINGLPGEEPLPVTLQADAAADALGRDQLASDARFAFEAAADVRRPLPLPMIAGPQWKPPTAVREELAALGSVDKQQEAQRKFQQLANEQRRRETFVEQQEEARRGDGDDRGGRGARGPGGDPQEPETENRRVQTLQRQIDEIDRRIARLEAEMLELGYDPQTGQPTETTGFVDEVVDQRLLEDGDASLWAHDVTAQPGATYRYRTRLAINNPLYGREPVLIESQRPLAASPVVYSEPSPWSEPVVVAPRQAFFLTSASDGRGGALGPSEPTASIEVFTFYYGYYRRATLTLRPGDLVFAEADMPDDLRLPVLAEAAGQADQVPPDRGGAPLVGTQPGRGGDPADQGDAGQGEPVPDEVPVAIDVYLVDVTFEPTQAEGPADRTTQPVAYFSRVGMPGLERRVATTDRLSDLYQMLSRSADEGRDQGQARAALEGPAQPRERERERTPTEGGLIGGGKGGGGG